MNGCDNFLHIIVEYLTAFFRSSTLTLSRPSKAAKHFATRAAYSSALCPCTLFEY